jgi:hypothetical protein
MKIEATQETYYFSTIKSNWFILSRETVAVYCENRTEHIDTLCGQNAVYINSVCTSQEVHHVSATKPNRLMLFRETHKYNLWAECRVLVC